MGRRIVLLVGLLTLAWIAATPISGIGPVAQGASPASNSLGGCPTGRCSQGVNICLTAPTTTESHTHTKSGGGGKTLER